MGIPRAQEMAKNIGRWLKRQTKILWQGIFGDPSAVMQSRSPTKEKKKKKRKDTSGEVRTVNNKAKNEGRSNPQPDQLQRKHKRQNKVSRGRENSARSII